MKKYLTYILFCLIILINTTDSFSKETIRYVGSSIIGEFIRSVSKKYRHVNFFINTESGSSGAEEEITEGDYYDLGGVAREVTPYLVSTKGLYRFIMGNDVIGVWVNKKNQTTDLSFGDLRDIFTGKITNWKTVGGEDIPITVYILSEKSATKKIFQNVILKGEKYYEKAEEVFENDLEVLDNVGRDVGGVGYLSLTLAINHSMAPNVKKINIAAYKPEIGNKHYPLRRPLYLITRGTPKSYVKRFIDWVTSPEGQLLLNEYYLKNEKK